MPPSGELVTYFQSGENFENPWHDICKVRSALQEAIFRYAEDPRARASEDVDCHGSGDTRCCRL
jgi:hypothetical protein